MSMSQRNTGGIGLFLNIALFVGVVVLAVELVPTVTEYTAAKRALAQAARAGSANDIRSDFDRRAMVDDIRSISGKDLRILADNGKNTVSFAYTREVHLVGPAYLLLRYTGRADY